MQIISKEKYIEGFMKMWPDADIAIATMSYEYYLSINEPVFTDEAIDALNKEPDKSDAIFFHDF